MGDIADMMLDGTLCEGCGVYMGSRGGFAVRCHSCAVSNKAERKAENIARSKAEQAASKKTPCTVCGKKVKAVGMANHIKDAHGVKA